MPDLPPGPGDADSLELAARDVVRFIDGAPDGIVVVGASGTIRYANRAAHTLLARSPDELVGEPLGIPLVAGRPHELEVRGADGRVLVVEVDFTPVQSEGESGWSVALRDVTRRAESNRALLELIQEREDAIAVTSHELRNPLTVMSGVVEAFINESEHLTSEQRIQTWRRLERQTARMCSVVEQFLDAARLDAGLFRPVPMQSVVLDVVLERLPELGDIVSLIDLHIPADATVLAHPEHLWTIVSNFLINAAKYAGTRVRLSAATANGTCTIAVADTGVGVAESQVERLFERYTRSDAVSSSRGGTGLGLWIARSIAECYDGGVWYEHVEPQGSVFACRLPAG